ncbi:MAG: hypothetical protein ACYSWP_08165 [Planctomycetota bacterium]|jgi:hypothetical protein
MKESPQTQKLEQMLKSSTIVAGGFMGTDNRDVNQIIDDDLTVLTGFDITAEQLAQKMRLITEKAEPGLGTWVKIDDNLRAMTIGAKGALTCPWPHPGRFNKTVTTAERIDLGQNVTWSDLSIHLIAEHGFFQGKGSTFRLEPDKLIRVILQDML